MPFADFGFIPSIVRFLPGFECEVLRFLLCDIDGWLLQSERQVYSEYLGHDLWWDTAKSGEKASASAEFEFEWLSPSLQLSANEPVSGQLEGFDLALDVVENGLVTSNGPDNNLAFGFRNVTISSGGLHDLEWKVILNRTEGVSGYNN